MKPERWQQIDELLQAALELDPEERHAFLVLACYGDEPLRQEVESLIVSHEQSENLLDMPLSQVAADLLVKGEARCVNGQIIGHYKVLARLGAGAMGEVYLAEDTRLGRKVALKLLPTDFTIDEKRVRRFEQEAQAASRLNHPNILTIHEIGQEDDFQFIATEFIDGQTLRQRLSSARMELSEALDVAMQAAGALAAANEAGIVHRDIKPENLMLRRDGYLKVLDFGLAKLSERQASADTDAPTRVEVTTEPGVVMGTVRYMSPEQARGLDLDARTDIFSLGVVLYEMIAGRAPFDGATMSDIIAAILKEEPVPLRQYAPNVPAELEWVLKKSLAKDREERYQTCRELYIDLKRLRQELELQSKLEGRTTARLKSDATSIGQDTNNLLHEVVTDDADGLAQPRWTVSRAKAFVAAAAAIVIFSLISFYAGWKSAPPPSPPTFHQLTFQRGTISTARFTSDGQTVIYSAAFDGKPMGLFTSRLDSSEAKSLKIPVDGSTTSLLSISLTGEMAILLDCEDSRGRCVNGTLAKLDVAGGTPRELQDHVYDADWSPDGKDLAIVRAVEGKYQLEYPMGTVLYRSPGGIGTMRVSPKGDMVAFTESPFLDLIGISLVVMNLKGERRILSEGWTGVNGIAWAPNGEEIWFAAASNRVTAIHAVSLSGRDRYLYEAPHNLSVQDISRDGRFLIYRGAPSGRILVGSTTGAEKERDLTGYDWSTSADISTDGKNLLFYEWGIAVGSTPKVYLRKMDGSNDPVRLGDGKALALSPDGKWALTLQQRATKESSTSQLVLLPTGSGEEKKLPPGNIIEYSYASWFPDGKQILFTGLEADHTLRSYVQDIASGEIRPITEEGIIALSVSPDGKRIVVWAPDQSPDGKYYLCAVNQAEPLSGIPIPNLDLGEIPIQWSADSRALYVRGGTDIKTQIYRIDLTSKRRQPVKEIAPDPVGLFGIEVNPGGVQVTRDGKSYIYTYWTTFRDLFLVKGLK
jgi:serine/threonine protein kinase/Tol biopolymer transport system component